MIKKTAGFTLIECMIVLVIVAILAIIAIPAYQAIIQKSRRSDATSSLIRVSLEQARYQADNLTYANSLTLLGYAAASVDSDNKYYTITVTSGTATAFSATATPKAGKSQATDSCGTFTITQGWPNDLSTAAKTCWNLG